MYETSKAAHHVKAIEDRHLAVTGAKDLETDSHGVEFLSHLTPGAVILVS
jgi:hypothetical protein